MGVEVELDRDICMGSGNCMAEAPTAFDLDDDGIAFVLDPNAVSEDTVVTIARKCPSQAISVHRDGTRLH